MTDCGCSIHADRGEPCGHPARVCLACEQECWGVDVRQPLMTPREVAAFLRIHYNTLVRIPRDVLPFHRIGTRGDRRYERRDVLAYLA